MQEHQISALFPRMNEVDLARLADDIKAHGLRSPILVYEAKILDGRNRFEACKRAKVKPVYADYTGDDPLGYVLSTNLHRRHLTDSQRAMIAAKIATTPRGRPTKDVNSAISHHLTTAQAAEKLEVSPHTVRRAKTIAAKSPEKAAEVESGAKSVHVAERELKAESKPAPAPLAAVDDRGAPIPKALLPLWERRGELNEHIKALSVIRVAVKRGYESQDPLYAEIGQRLHVELDAVYHLIASSKPYCVCPMCQGTKCQACKNTGFLGKFKFKTIVPREFKKAGE